jgi:hypothetical protein
LVWALALIAFLAAIFEVYPSAFYVMDKAEADLYDVNLTRLPIVLMELQGYRSSSSSPTKRTMEIANAPCDTAG